VLALECQSMSKTRQRWPDGSVGVRTYPVTFLHDHTEQRCDRKWHLLAFATRGHLEIVTTEATQDARRLVPSEHAVWIPAGTSHTSVMRAPISMRSIFIAARLAPKATALRTIAVEPLLRALILHATKLGALDRGVPEQARLTAVLLDRLAAAPDVVYELRSPRDPRARRFADLVAGSPGDNRTIAELARAAGTSLRTLERCYLVETGLGVGEWRRRVRLFHALHRLQRGDSVTEVALDCGYATPSAFGVAFRRQFGHAPKLGRRAS
jgi:AraC-like DNA-binding protein